MYFFIFFSLFEISISLPLIFNGLFSSFDDSSISSLTIKEYVDAQDIANQVMYLASDAGMHVSGQAIAIDCDTKMLL